MADTDVVDQAEPDVSLISDGSAPDAYELPEGVGYFASGVQLADVVITEDDTNDRMRLTCTDPRWNASGELGPTKACIIYDDTASDDMVIGCIEFGEEVTVNNGSALEIQSIILDLN